MKKILFYAMKDDKMCFLHILMNAVDLHNEGHDIKVIFEGQSVKLPPILEKDKNPHYIKAKEECLIAGVCLACAKTLGAYDDNEAIGMEFLDDMFGHAGMKSFVDQGYEVISM